MGGYIATRRQARGSTGPDGITIQFAKKQTFAYPLHFEVRIQVELGGHELVWTMDVLPGMRVPICLDQDQRLILIAHGQELLVDSSGMDRTFPISGTGSSAEPDRRKGVSRSEYSAKKKKEKSI